MRTMVGEINGPGNAATHNAVNGERKLESMPAAAGTPARRGAGATDAVSVTGTAAGLLALEQAVAEVPAVDSARVAELRAAIADGTYSIDYERTAAKLLQLEALHPDRGGER